MIESLNGDFVQEAAQFGMALLALILAALRRRRRAGDKSPPPLSGR